MILPGNYLLPMGSAISHLRDYPDAIVHLYDGVQPKPHDEIRGCDVTSLAALNMFVGGGARAMTALWNERLQIEALLRPVTHAPLESLTGAQRAVMVKRLNNVLMRVNDIPGWGGSGVLASKLLHRLRPNVAPIWDTHAGAAWFPQFQNDADWVPWLSAAYDAILCEQNLAELKHLSSVVCTDLFGVELSIVRVWDIILWSEGQP